MPTLSLHPRDATRPAPGGSSGARPPRRRPRRRWLAVLLALLAGPATARSEPTSAAAGDPGAEGTTGASGASPAQPGEAGAARPGLRVDLRLDSTLTGAALVAWGALELAQDRLVPARCRWCTAPGIDVDARRALAWSSTEGAKLASDALLLSIPGAFAVYDVLATRDDGGLRTAVEDVLVVAEAVALTGIATDVAKYSFARLRPYATDGGAGLGAESRVSFWSGHTALAFAAAAASGSVAQMRGYPGWEWVYGLGFGAAAATGYFRLAADQHWLTDVVAAAAAGTGIGFLVPWLHRSALPGRITVLVLPDQVAVAGSL